MAFLERLSIDDKRDTFNFPCETSCKLILGNLATISSCQPDWPYDELSPHPTPQFSHTGGPYQDCYVPTKPEG